MSIEQPQPGPLESDLRQESVEGLRTLFEEAERTLEASGGPEANRFLPAIYSTLQELNKSDMSDWKKVWIWNPEGVLTEADFNELNLRRKKLSNGVGIMTSSGVGRHDLNKV